MPAFYVVSAFENGSNDVRIITDNDVQIANTSNTISMKSGFYLRLETNHHQLVSVYMFGLPEWLNSSSFYRSNDFATGFF